MGLAMRRSSLVVLAIALTACGGAAMQTIVVDGHTRSFIVHVPAHRSPGPLPLVIAMHGGGGTAQYMQRETKFDQLADREGFAVVYPQGLNRHWHDSDRPNDSVEVDDVAFIRALIDRLIADYNVDANRVFATGISNGGIMSYRLACDLADKVAAIAPVVGGVPQSYAAMCHPSRPVSVLAINSTLDPIVPYGGGPVRALGTARGNVVDAETSAQMFAVADHCSDPVTVKEPDRAPEDGTTVRRTDYACSDGIAVQQIAVEGGGHTWPGGMQYLPRGLVGVVSREFSASERIWEFFRTHGRPPK
jgi:polyhydroxybutyrate depolymerase